MARWKKLLSRMLSDDKPVSYDYEDAANVLRALGFVEAPKGGTSHRRWRLKLEDGTLVVVGLVEPGTLKPGYIRDMVATLLKYGLAPVENSENEDAPVDRSDEG